MRVLVVADGSRGDVQPMSVLAAQLASEGHDVTVAAPPSLRFLIEPKGLRFVPLKFDSEAMIRANARSVVGTYFEVLPTARRLFMETTESQLETLPDIAKQHDFILAGGVHTGAATLAEYAGIPWRWVIYTTGMVPSNHHPPITAPFGSAPRWVNWLLWQFTRWFTNATFKTPINKHRKRLGLPPLTDAAQAMLGLDPIVAMEPELAPSPPDWPPTEYIGYLDPGDGDPLPAELEAFLAAGPAPIYIGFGSMPDPDPAATTRIFVEATRRAGVRAVISRGWADFGNELPEHCFAVGSVSHPRLFARVSAVVHHGGAGTTAAATRAGKPQLIVPHIADQFQFGPLVHRLGIAVPPLKRTKLTLDALTDRLRELTSNAAMAEQARALGEHIRARPRLQNASRLLVSASAPVKQLTPHHHSISV
jgi:vancomycin aglycone glucosyltransferase